MLRRWFCSVWLTKLRPVPSPRKHPETSVLCFCSTHAVARSLRCASAIVLLRKRGDRPRVSPSGEIKPLTAKITDYQPGKSLSVLLANQRSLVVAVTELDDTKADILVRFTDESGSNRDEASEAAIHRVLGASFDSELRTGMSNLGGKVRPGTGFGMPTESDVPGQTICSTSGPTYKPDPALASEKLGNAYDVCFGLGSMRSALSLAFPAYEGSATGFPTEVAAPVVAERLVEGLSHETRVQKVTVAVSAAGFAAYSEAVLKRLGLPAKISP